MRAPGFILRRLDRWADRLMASRAPDFVIGEPERPYLERWWAIPRNRWFNIYVHRVLRSDDDRALHDHPWLNCSIVVRGSYREHVIEAGGIERRLVRGPGSIVARRAKAAHRLEITPGHEARTIFITGPRIRDWGFHCPQAGWRHWREFTGGERGEVIGRGCGE